MKWFRHVALSTAAILAIGGCGGGSSSSGDAASGGIVDGYVAGATIFADADGNGMRGDAELTTTSDANGDFTLSGTIVDGTVVYGSGGTDLSSGLPFEGRLKSIYQSGRALMLSPLTTYTAALVQSGASWDDASAAVATKLGIDAALVNSDPMENANAFLAAQKVQKVAEVIASATTGDGTFDAAYEAVFASLAAESGTSFDASALVAQVEADQNVTLDASVSTFVQTLATKIDEIAAQDVGTDALNSVGDVINTYAEVAEGAIENNESLESVTQQLDDLNASDDLASQAQSLDDALQQVEDALDGLHYLGNNTADDQIVGDLNLSDPAAAPFNTADLNLTWSSNHAAVNAETGAVTRSDTVDVDVALKARVNNAQVTNSRTYNLVVRRNEHAPVAGDDAATLDEDGNVTVAVLANDSDGNGDALTVTPLAAPAHGTATYHSDGTVTYVPEANFNGSDSFTYTLTDTTGRSDSAAVSLTVTAVNDAPTISGLPTLSVKQGTAYSFTPTAADVDGDPLTFGIVNLPAWAAFDTATGTLSGTPTVANVGITHEIIISVTDGTATTTLAAFNLEVTQTAVPVAEGFAVSTDEDSAVQVDVVAHATDSDGTIDATTVSASGAAHGALAVNGTTGVVTYTPAADYNGADSFTYTVADNDGAVSNSATVSVTVNAVNDVPVLDTLANIALNDSGSPVIVTAHATDADGDTITYSAVSSNTGVATVAVSGAAITVTPVASGVATVTVTASDGSLQATKTFSVNVSSVAVSDMTWYDGKVVYGFWVDEEEGQISYVAEQVTLNAGSLEVVDGVFNPTDGTWSMFSETPDMILQDGVWAPESSVRNYTVSADGTVMTVNGTEEVKVDSVIDLEGVTFALTNDINVTFGAGAKRYMLAFKRTVERYTLAWQPVDWSNSQAPFTTIEACMNSGYPFYWDEINQVGVRAEGTVGTLSAGMTGNLVTTDASSTVVGTWEAGYLPGQEGGTLTVFANLSLSAPNYASYTRYGTVSATLYNGTVYMVEYQDAMSDFVVDEEDLQGNLDAQNAIKAAVEEHFTSSNAVTPNDASIVGAWAVAGEDSLGNAVPFAALLIVVDNAHYFMTQQMLGMEGLIGGVEVGSYTLNNGAFTLAEPFINTNAGDTATCGTMTDNGDGTALFAEVYGCGGITDPGEVNATRLSNGAEAGAWIANYTESPDGNFSFVAMVLDGAGNYMLADVDSSQETTWSATTNSDGGKNNMTEFGTYVVNGGTVTMTADAATDFSAVCTELDPSGCDTVAGDSNGDYGVNPLMTATVSFTDSNTLMITPEGSSEPIVFTRITQNGPFTVPQ